FPRLNSRDATRIIDRPLQGDQMKRLAIVLVAAMLGLTTPLYAADKDAKMAAKPATTASQTDDKIDINRAKADQLMTLEGIGDARAKAIIKGRPYKGKDELVE